MSIDSSKLHREFETLAETITAPGPIDVGRAIEAGLDAFSGVEALRSDYEREKPARLKLLIWRDLARLQEERTGY